MQVRTRSIATSLLTLFVLLLPRVSFAQGASLEKVDSLIGAGQTEQARAALDLWKKDNTVDARSTFLGARLAARAEEAEDAYLMVALSYSSSPYAAESLLRLGQARHAAGDSRQAAIYFQRVISDYPGSPHRATAEQWLARSSPAPAPAPAPAPTRVRHAFAVQVAAFRAQTGARSVARDLEKAGFTNARLVTVPSNTLIRVRIGNFEKAADASALAAKVKAAGFSAAVVSDARSEQSVRN